MINVLIMIAVSEEDRERFLSIPGYDCRFVRRKDVSEEDLTWAEAIIGQPDPSSLCCAEKLRWLQTNTAGVNRYLDLPEGILLSNAYGSYGEGIGEFLTALTLASQKNLYGYDAQQKAHHWEAITFPSPLSEKKVLSVGMGHIGREYLKRMAFLGAKCYGVRRGRHEKPDYVEEVYTTEELPDILQDMDIVALSLPETKETIHLFNEEMLGKMKEDAVLLNIGRGSVIDTDALVKCCQEGKFKDVFLDVHEIEPLPEDHPLWDLPQVHITPHVAGRYEDPVNKERVLKVILENMERYRDGRDLIHTVEAKKGY